MTIEVSDYIPNEKMKQFNEILSICGGRYIINPSIGKISTYVRYEIEVNNYNRLNVAWNRVTTNITEVNKDQLWRKIFRRIKLLIS